MELRLHQRLDAVCGAEGLRTAAFCSLQDAIAVGSRDGVLGLWTKVTGLPPETKTKKRQDRSNVPLVRSKTDSGGNTTAWILDRPLARPMMHVTPQGCSSDMPDAGIKEERRSLQNSEWFVRSDLRTLSRTMSIVGSAAAGCYFNRGTRPTAVSPNIRAQLNAAHDRKKLSAAISDDKPSTPVKDRSIKRWKSRENGEFEDVLSAFCKSAGGDKTNSTMSGNFASTAPPAFGSRSFSSPVLHDSNEGESPDADDAAAVLRKTRQFATRGLVQRIALDPQVIC
jgi:hypothetical protein